MQAASRTLFAMLIVMAFVATVNAGEKFFYQKGTAAYYCARPTVYTPGVFAVCDDPKVIKIGQYPTMTNTKCKQLVKQTAAKSSPPKVQPSQPNGVKTKQVAYQVQMPVGNKPRPCEYCPPSPGPNNCVCYPRLGQRCYCESCPKCECFYDKPGSLQVKCVRNSFYRGIDEVEAVVHVPELCVVEDETYHFKPIIYRYNCADYAAKCKKDGLDCDFSGVNCSKCDVHTCVVYKRCTQCRIECRLVKRSGTVLIAVRRQTVNGQLVADVILGTPGVASFPEYARNTTILREATASQISRCLSIPGIDLTKIAGNTDLRKYLGPSQPCN